MNEKDFSKIMERLEDFWPNFFAGRDKQKTFDLWYQLFRKDEAEDMARAVTICICTLKFPPTVADIKQQMAECRLEDQPTAIEAFHTLSAAVKKAWDKAGAAEAFNALPPILRRIAGSSGQLISWNRLSDESFQTVVMSAIRESYTTLAKREAKYYALPAGLQRAEGWRIEAPEPEALPEPAKEKTLEAAYAEADQQEAEFRSRLGIEAKPEYAERVSAFMQPMTAEEIKLFEAKKKRQEDIRLERMMS